MDNFDPSNLDDVLKFFNKLNKSLYGVDIPTVNEPTVQELNLREMTGLPVKVERQ